MKSAPTIGKISLEDLDPICRELSANDPSIRRAYERYGAPPLWAREPSFATLIHIILEQQVSLASAKAAYEKLMDTVGEITPENILALSDEEMRAAYFSRQKAVYARELSKAVIEKRLVIGKLGKLPDREVRTTLTQVKGIGRWTSDIFLLMCLCRPDVMPVGDIALHQAWKELRGLETRPTSKDFPSIAERWRPYRSVAARLLWHFYLSERGRS
ncbi:MAG: DNA-3-methyladenine glycosylase 2 family protein [Acidobacteriota bacterium]|nr:MAG: DNA-3-methyladenine glycosylase 2 family protein [Acidobacteriota bacterium]